VTASDGVLSDSESFTITVNDVNRAPTADAQVVATAEGTPVAVTLAGSDPDGDTLTFTIGQRPASGTLSVSAPDVVYTPNTGFVGDDSFTFTASDGDLTSGAATVTVTVESASPRVDQQQAVGSLEDLAAAVTDPSLDLAIGQLTASLNPAYWADDAHLAAPEGRPVFRFNARTVRSLTTIVGTYPEVGPVIDTVVAASRQLAATSIGEAVSAGRDPGLIAQAQSSLDQGDTQAAAGNNTEAVTAHAAAWRAANRATR